MGEMKIDASEVAKGLYLRINVVGAKRMSIRIKLGLAIMRFAAWVLPLDAHITLDGPFTPERVRPGVNGSPPVAYDVGDSRFSPDIGRRLVIKLDGEPVESVSSYDTEAGWVEQWRGARLERSAGDITVEWLADPDEDDGEAECLACGRDCKGECDRRYEEARDLHDEGDGL